ncbi:Na+/H+ antiporter NhaB [hydrothermal vent metagenome]|uniref:Na+/H+ antiporter NhaB n=1 Tax=hydrothermal vent metagenome TaxID=652676 RepID=A0A3B1BXT0_9ZZZZ
MSVMMSAFWANFLGRSPKWYKMVIISFIIINPILLFVAGPFVTGWAIMAQFIFTLAMALQCYPLQPGGLLAIEAVAMGMASTKKVYEETLLNFPVILLLIFMVAGIYFMKDFLLFVFTNLIIRAKSKIVLSLMFCFTGAFLSAFLDALTVTAVIIAVALGFYSVFHRHASTGPPDSGQDQSGDSQIQSQHIKNPPYRRQVDHDHTDDSLVFDEHTNNLDQFRGFLRNILMHGAVGTALGGVMTLVGEPQNLLIANMMEWQFLEFFLRMTPVTIPVFFVGLSTCVLVEKFKILGYGYQLPDHVRSVLEKFAKEEAEKRNEKDVAKLWAQGVIGIILIISLALHVAEVGIIGLMVIILLTTFTGVTEEHQIGKAFEEALPFAALLVVFFSIVAVIHEQHLFKPVIDFTLSMKGNSQLVAFYMANGLLSAISDNVFVATIYISEAKAAFDAAVIDRAQFDLIAVAINTGTNIPSVATPNGQAAFLFLLTSAVASLIRLSYMQMIMLALPYTITMSITGLLATIFLL